MWIRNETKRFRKSTEPTKTSSRVQATSVFTGPAVSTNCAQFFDSPIAASHLQRVYQAGHLCQNWQLRVNDTSFVNDQVLCKRMLTITYNKRTLSDFLPLTLQLILTQWISLEIRHAPPRCFQTQALITVKVTTALEMPQHFMISMCERDTFFRLTRQ